jgi:TPP-dependent pyruvate/acetoin dehydrogenase alpha subunit
MGVLTEGEADKIDQEVAEEMDKAVKFAEESAFPEPGEVYADEFA